MSIELIQGDCLEKMQDIPDKSIDFVCTDLPYGTTACSWDTIIPLEPMWEQVKRVIKPNGAIALFSSQPFTTVLISSNMKMFKYEWIWEKPRGGMFVHAKNRPLKSHENIIIFSTGVVNHEVLTDNRMSYYPIMGKGKPSQKLVKSKNRENATHFANRPSHRDMFVINNGDRYPKTVLNIGHTCNNEFHPTQKPVKLLEYLIKTYTVENETVLDFTMGSGSTGCACIETNRNFIGIELDENYFNIATDRIDKAKQSPKLFY